jgi:hypothetical protein
MLLASLAMSVAIVVAGLASQDAVVAVVVSTLVALAAGMAVAFGPTAADLGLVCLLMFTTYAAHPLAFEAASSDGVLALSGGLLQTAISLALWPVRRYKPERRVLAALYLGLARMIVEPSLAVAAPPASAAATRAQQMLQQRRDNSPESERHRSLLAQAERVRLSILALARLRRRIERDGASKEDASTVGRFLEESRRVLGSLARALLTGNMSDRVAGRLAALQQIADDWRARHSGSTRSFHAAVASDVRFQMDALAGQLRAATNLAGNTEWRRLSVITGDAARTGCRRARWRCRQSPAARARCCRPRRAAAR